MLKSIGVGVHELRVDFGPGYRVYLGIDGLELLILLGGSAKSREARRLQTRKTDGTTTGAGSAATIRSPMMPLTRDFRETVKARADRDPEFRAGLYQEAVQVALDGDLGTARVLLRDFINTTVGFAQLGSRIGVPEKSLMRMFAPDGNPWAENLVAVVAALKEVCGLSLTVTAKPIRRVTRRPARPAA